MMKRIVRTAIWTIMLILLIVRVSVSAQGSILQLDKNIYAQGEIVNINLNTENLENLDLSIKTQLKNYKYTGNFLPTLSFLPQELGTHTITLKDKTNNQILDSIIFDVQISDDSEAGEETNGSGQVQTENILEKKQYELGETVLIRTPEFESLRIIFEDKSYNFLGSWQEEISFKPEKRGEYKIIMTLPAGEELIEIFEVTEKTQSQERLKVKDSKGREIASTSSTKAVKENGRQDINIQFKNSKVKEIEFYSLAFSGEMTLGLEENLYSEDIFGRKIKSVYSINPEKLDFERGVVTVTAEGEELWKCRDWNFTAQACYGTWVKVKNLVPGHNYTFTITPDDPGYAETGLSTINTNQSIYEPGDIAEIIMAVLDTQGFLVSNADVTLTITDPANQESTFSTGQGTVSQAERGIYKAYYSETSLEGDYLLTVHAQGAGVDSNMTSFFRVDTDHEFDIIRYAPYSIDPFKGPFSSSIKVMVRANVTSFNLTEKVPLNFTVTDSGGAFVSEAEEKRELVWSGLESGDIITYYVQAPPISPELWELGQAVILSSLGEFIEVKPWYLAADPLVESRPTVGTDEASPKNIGTNIPYAYDSDFETSATLDIDKNGNPAYVTYTVFNISNFNNASVLNSFNITYTVSTTGTFSDDNWYLEYSTNAGVDWTVCYSDQTAITPKQNLSCNVSFASWTLQDFADNFQTRAGGDKDGREDGVSLNLFEIFAELNYTLPNVAPTPISWNKNTTSVYVNDTVDFNATWVDSDGTLDSWIFQWNLTSGWVNVTASTFSGNLSNTSQQVNAPQGTIVQWRFFANDTEGAGNYTPIQTFTVLGADIVPPAITNESVTPITGVSGTQFNITANATDDQTIQNIWAEVMLSNGARENMSMLSIDSYSYSLIYNSTSGGNISFIVYAYDGNNYNISATRQYFNVTSNITTDLTYYARGDTVQITGSGFYPNSTVSLDILDPSGSSLSGDYPSSVTANSSGGFSTTWNISSALTTYLGNYTINASDDTLSWLQSEKDVVVVIKPAAAVKLNDNPGSGNPKRSYYAAFSDINDSDNVYANLVSSGEGEVYVEANFSDVLPAGYNINSATLYFEHYEISAVSTYVQWYNSSADAYQTVCTIPNQSTEVFSSCNLSAYVSNSTAANSLSIRLSDNGDGTNNDNWTMIDFVYLDIDFELSYDLTITINEPYKSATTYDSNNANTRAYSGSSVANPPAVATSGSPASSGELTNISASNDNYYHTIVSGAGTLHVYQSYKFIVSEAISDISSVTFTHEGYATKTTNAFADGYTIYLWNYTSGAYQSVAVASPSGSDQTTIGTLSGNSSDFINRTGEVWMLVEGDFATGGGPNAQADLWTDYVSFKVNNIPVMSSWEDINATATDGDGVAGCSYFYINSTGDVASLYYPMSYQGDNIWLESSNTNLYNDGYYTLYINCTDNISNSFSNASIYVKIANGEPTIYLVEPPYYSNFTYSNVNFTWNATQSSGSGVLLCNLSIDGTNVVNDVSSNNGEYTTRNYTVADGLHYWNVTCLDSSGIANTSNTWIVNVDTTNPQITLNSPNASDYLNVSGITFYYTPTDTHNITNCSLIINGQINQTNSTITNGTTNPFLVSYFNEGFYNWTVNCTDSFNRNGTTETRWFTVDRDAPDITLLYPPPNASTGSTVNFTWNVTDNLDSILYCNITVNGEVEQSNISSQSGQITNYTLPVTDGPKYWNITCWDNASNKNTSETRMFNVTGPPNVNHESPENNYWTNESEFNLTFYVADGNGIQNCSLYWDGDYNYTLNYTQITNYDNNTFNVSNVSEGLHNWSVLCYDNSSEWTQTGYWNITVDYTKPNITLDSPKPNQTFYNSTIDFNFSVTDNLDSSLICNLTLDGNISATNNNFLAVNGTVTNITETGIDEGLHHWNITCWDNATNWNTSETRNFSIDTGPTVNLTSPEDNNISQDNITFLFYVEDLSGIFNCTLVLDGSLNDSLNYSEVQNYNNNTINLTDISEGLHNWSVLCIDNGSQSTQPTALDFRVDTTPPSVTALSPNGTMFSYNDIEFNFTVTDDVSTSIRCNVSVDNGNYSSVVTATNGLNESTTINSIRDGPHYWNVTCWDEAGNPDYSEVLNFTIDAAPQVFLDFPTDGYGDIDGDVVFTYEVDDDTLQNCSLILNNKINQTNVTAEIPHIGDTLVNNFTVYNMDQGLYNWTVNCTDSNNYTGTDTPRLLHVDWTYPNVTLHEPENDTNLSYSTVTFNFTAYDNVDPELECNVSAFGSINQSQLVNATNGIATTVDISGFIAGNYTWNVSCNDNSNLENYSKTWMYRITSYPSIELQSPDNNSVDGDGDIVFWYLAQDLEALSYCDFHFDGLYNDTKVTGDGGVKNGLPSNFSMTGQPEGNHTWYVNCTDNNSNKVTSEKWVVWIDLTDPNVTLNYPDGQTLNNSAVTFNWTAYDNYDLNLTCNLSVDGSSYDGLNSPNATPTTYNVSGFNDTTYFWNVSCSDDGYRSNVSLNYNFTVQEPPKVGLGDPVNESRTNATTRYIYYYPTDNSGALKNCTLILNGVDNHTNSSVNPDEYNNFTVVGLPHGTYVWDVNCTDNSNNSAINGSAKTFYVDTFGPSINLTYPNATQTFNQNNIDFNWTATDFAGIDVICNLSVSDPDGQRNVTGLTKVSGSNFNATLLNLSDGVHWWNITCVDDLGNKNTSYTINFTINQPDLYINNSEIYFNNTNPDLSENITIYANVSNIGGSNANSVLVEFWDGQPATGTYIGNHTRNVATNDTVLFNTTWLIGAGYHEVWVVIDFDNDVEEENETNNNASRNISVLRAYISYPENDTWTTNSTAEINFTMEDYTLGLINYTIFRGGTGTGQTGNSSDNVSKLLNVSLGSEGTHYIEVEATDYMGRKKNSTKLYVNYDQSPPNSTFLTQNSTFFNDTTPEISFNISDNLASIVNYTLYVDGVQEKNDSINESIITYLNLSVLSEGEYNLTLEGVDQAGNRANSSIIIFIDLTDPTINLTYPPNGENFTVVSTQLNFSVTDNLDSELMCNVTLDATVVNESVTVANRSTSSTTVSDLSEGAHYWNITCWDGRDIDNIVNINTSETRNFSVFIAPTIVLTSPDDNNWSNQKNQTFYFNVSDDTGLENCSILLDGSVTDVKNGSELVNNGQNNFTVNNLNGTYVWEIECYDNTSYNTYNISENRTLYVDLDPPQPYILTPNQTWFSTGTPGIAFYITDNMDLFLDYIIYDGENPNVQGTIGNNTLTNVSLTDLANGTYGITVEGIDNASNRQNSTNITIYVDTVKPSVALHYPEDGNVTANNSVYFNWTADDNMASTLECNLSIDGTQRALVNVTAGIGWNETVLGLSAGLHYWNVTCKDLAGNINYSETRNFTVPMPDLYIHWSNIEFNDTTPEENSSMMINATIKNIGNTNASSFLVSFFSGDPDEGGTQINENLTVDSLGAGENTTVNVTYNPFIGPNNIFVRVDVPLATNGSITEQNESNNEANRSFSVEHFHIFAGNTFDYLRVTDDSFLTLFDWSGVNLTGSNVYVTDTDSNIAWLSLQAITRNISNGTAYDDFSDIDSAFGSENFSDSINATFSLNNAPKLTQTFTVYSSDIPNVPIVNSTNTSNFVTGILWDSNDGGIEYNGTQDLVFITEINEDQPGMYGIYDYEIKVPAPLRDYKGGTNTVTFYTEIK